MFKPGERIYFPGGSGEPTDLKGAVFGACGVDIMTSFVPGVNRLIPETIGEGSRVTGLFMQSDLATAQRDGRFRHLPLSYAAMTKFLEEIPAFDSCVVQVTQPDAFGRCSLGPAAEFTHQVLRRASRVIALINPNIPFIPNAPKVLLEDCSIVLETDKPVVCYDVGKMDSTSEAIAQFIASRIGDGAVIQTGLGKIPNAFLAALRDRRGLRLHSGMISDGVIGLAESGALDPAWPHTTTALLGTSDLYQWAEGRPDIHVAGTEFTHNPARLATIENFFAVNSAVEVDLFGQCNLEFAGGRAISGVGGAPDFSRAARLSRGGLSIVALPATFGQGRESRIRAWLGLNSMVSLARTEVDLIITEEGIADLRGLSVHERAKALINVATPAARGELTDKWREIAAKI